MFWGLQCRPFAQQLKTKNNDYSDEEPTNKEIDIYPIIALALKCGISYTDLGNMELTTLLNILDVFTPNNKPTQEQIDMIAR